jgi:hypothetical protein
VRASSGTRARSLRARTIATSVIASARDAPPRSGSSGGTSHGGVVCGGDRRAQRRDCQSGSVRGPTMPGTAPGWTHLRESERSRQARRLPASHDRRSSETGGGSDGRAAIACGRAARSERVGLAQPVLHRHGGISPSDHRAPRDRRPHGARLRLLSRGRSTHLFLSPSLFASPACARIRKRRGQGREWRRRGNTSLDGRPLREDPAAARDLHDLRNIPRGKLQREAPGKDPAGDDPAWGFGAAGLLPGRAVARHYVSAPARARSITPA